MNENIQNDAIKLSAWLFGSLHIRWFWNWDWKCWTPSDYSDQSANFKDDDADTSKVTDRSAAGMHITPTKSKRVNRSSCFRKADAFGMRLQVSILKKDSGWSSDEQWKIWLLSVFWIGCMMMQVFELWALRWDMATLGHVILCKVDVSSPHGAMLSAVWPTMWLSCEFIVSCFFQCPPLEVEIDDWCTRILKLRMADGLLHTCPVSEDVTSFDASETDAEGSGGGSLVRHLI